MRAIARGLCTALALLVCGASAVRAQSQPIALAVTRATQRSSQSGIGFNAGIDGAYLYTRHIGVGASAVFTRAHVPIGTSAESHAGGLHVAAGLRVRF